MTLYLLVVNEYILIYSSILVVNDIKKPIRG